MLLSEIKNKTQKKSRAGTGMIWFVENNVPCDWYYLKNKMAQTGHIDVSEALTKEKLINFLVCSSCR